MSVIHNREAYAAAAWDCDWFEPLCDDIIQPSDIDKILERYGNFLSFEMKRPGQDIKRGQQILFDALASIPGWTHIVLWGEREQPEKWSVWPRPAESVTRDHVEGVVRQWWEHANAHPVPSRRQAA